MLDSIIIGGSSAGLSAALTLGRALRHVIVLDSGEPCNRFSHASHGFLTQDGTSPSEIVAQGRKQLAKYDTVKLYDQRATSVKPIDGGFEVVVADGTLFQARKLVLATGLRDELPPFDGIEAFWGKSVFHCPYCDGYETHHQGWVVYNPHESVHHQAMVLSQWTDNLTLCTDGKVQFSATERESFAAHGIRIIETPVVGVRGEGHQIEAILLADGGQVACRTVFIRPTPHHAAPFARELGCACDEYGLVTVDILGRTSVAGVYAAGDLSNPRRNVALAVAQGVSAGQGVNYDLIVERFAG